LDVDVRVDDGFDLGPMLFLQVGRPERHRHRQHIFVKLADLLQMGGHSVIRQSSFRPDSHPEKPIIFHDQLLGLQFRERLRLFHLFELGDVVEGFP
jgi:hypothetical protein